MGLEEQLARHRAIFIASLPARRKALSDATASFARGETGARDDLERVVHRLAGSAGVHGLAALSSAAMKILQGLGEPRGREDDVASSEEMAALFAALDELSPPP